MKLRFTEEHELLRQTARRFLADRCPMSAVREFAEGDTRCHDPLLRGMAEQGWPGMLIDARYDGAGLDCRSLAVVLEEAGRHLTPAPLLANALAGNAIATMGNDDQKRHFLPRLADGSAVGTVALSEPGGSWEPDAVACNARACDTGYVLNGVKTHVLWAERADVLIAPAQINGEIRLFAIPLEGGESGIHIVPEVGVDATRCMARVTLDGVRVDWAAYLADGDLQRWRAVHMRGYALIAAEMTGAAQAALTMTRDYANERVQFARPIGSFQGVKHPLVDVLITLERARSLCAGAVHAIDEADSASQDSSARDLGQAEYLARMAKAAATEALNFAVDRGVQLHGGFGFTWDCDMHWYFKRALWSAATLGDASHHRRHLANRLFG